MLHTEVLKIRRGIDLGRKIRNLFLDVLSPKCLLDVYMSQPVRLETTLKVCVVEEEPVKRLRRICKRDRRKSRRG